jgi:uncharacterized protein involved in exopolysaccharide biosynthesis
MNPPPLSSPPAKPSSRGSLLYCGIVIVTFLLVFFSACVVTYLMPKKYESTAVLQVMPSQRAIDAINHANTSTHFFATEFEVITSTMTLKPVVQRLNLASRWGILEEQAVAMLKQLTMVNRIPDTNLIKITVKHTNPEEARDIAQEIYLSYKKRYEDKVREYVESYLKELEMAILDQSDVVEEKRKQRDRFIRVPLTNPPSRLPYDNPEFQSKLRELQAQLSNEQDTLDAMREKLHNERKNSHDLSQVILHEEPVIAQFPSSPNVNLNLAMGAGLGLLLGGILALIVRLVRGGRR